MSSEPNISPGDECTLAAFLLHPCSIKVMGCFNTSTLDAQRAVEDNGGGDATCDMHYQCNDQFMDVLMVGSSSSQSGSARHHDNDHTIVETPRMQSTSVLLGGSTVAEGHNLCVSAAVGVSVSMFDAMD